MNFKYILVVDDNESVRSTLKKVIEKKGYVPLLAENTPQAMELLKKHGKWTGLALLDYHLGDGFSGSAVATEILINYPWIYPVSISILPRFITQKGQEELPGDFSNACKEFYGGARGIYNLIDNFDEVLKRAHEFYEKNKKKQPRPAKIKLPPTPKLPPFFEFKPETESNERIKIIGSPEIGGKGASLQWLKKFIDLYGKPLMDEFGFEMYVPRTAILSHAYFETFLKGISGYIQETLIEKIKGSGKFSWKDKDYLIKLVNEHGWRSTKLIRTVKEQSPELFYNFVQKIEQATREIICATEPSVFIERKIEEAIQFVYKTHITPIIVRSSGISEGKGRVMFHGIYESEFTPIFPKLSHVIKAVKKVWASTFSKRAIIYRLNNQVPEEEESMSVIIQSVIGEKIGEIFMPHMSGVVVASETGGSVRTKGPVGYFALGLGVLIVDERGNNVWIVLDKKERKRYRVKVEKNHQNKVDLVDRGGLRSAPDKEVIEHLEKNHKYDLLRKTVSIYRDGKLYPYTEKTTGEKYITLEGFKNHYRLDDFFLKLMKTIENLNRRNGSKQPVDIEFAIVEREGKLIVYLLQLTLFSIHFPKYRTDPSSKLPQETIWFYSPASVGVLKGKTFRYVVYVDPEKYAKLGERERLRIGDYLDHLDKTIDDEYILIIPGKMWSKTVDEGVVTNSLLSRAGFLIELSYGNFEPWGGRPSHFFLELINKGGVYSACFKGDEWKLDLEKLEKLGRADVEYVDPFRVIKKFRLSRPTIVYANSLSHKSGAGFKD